MEQAYDRGSMVGSCIMALMMSVPATVAAALGGHEWWAVGGFVGSMLCGYSARSVWRQHRDELDRLPAEPPDGGLP
jgi:hypothetical protein